MRDSSMEDFQEPRRKKAKSGDGKQVLRCKRFVVPASKEEMTEICKGFVPKNMKKATNWAVKVFKQWRVQRNEVADDAKLCPSNLLECPKASELNYWLA